MIAPFDHTFITSDHTISSVPSVNASYDGDADVWRTIKSRARRRASSVTSHQFQLFAGSRRFEEPPRRWIGLRSLHEQREVDETVNIRRSTTGWKIARMLISAVPRGTSSFSRFYIERFTSIQIIWILESRGVRELLWLTQQLTSSSCRRSGKDPSELAHWSELLLLPDDNSREAW